jgi:hypothetical protein
MGLGDSTSLALLPSMNPKNQLQFKECKDNQCEKPNVKVFFFFVRLFVTGDEGFR